MINRGVSNPDGSYTYTCLKCQGRGTVGGQPCDHCYGLDTAAIAEAIRMGAQGERYYALLKAMLSVSGKAIHDEAIRLDHLAGKLVIVDVGYLAIKYGLSFKATFEWLEETHVSPTGTHEQVREWMRRNKKKVADIFEAAREKYPEIAAAREDSNNAEA